MTHRYLVALVKPNRLYGGYGLGWGKQLQCHMFDMYIFKNLFLQHICNITFLIVATPLLYACQKHLCGKIHTVYFSTHKVSHNFIIIFHVVLSCFINLSLTSYTSSNYTSYALYKQECYLVSRQTISILMSICL